jgi:hypothetical protein
LIEQIPIERGDDFVWLADGAHNSTPVFGNAIKLLQGTIRVAYPLVFPGNAEGSFGQGNLRVILPDQLPKALSGG